MSRYTLVNGLGLPPRAAIASSWLTAELRRVHGPHLIPMSARFETYKQLQRTVTRRRGRAARAPFIMHVRRASYGSARPLNCGVRRRFSLAYNVLPSIAAFM